MTNHNADDDAVATQPVEGAESAPAAEETVPAGQVTAALEAAADFKDKLLRTLADMENLRKRTEREVADARSYSITGFARDVLAVADNMHRALEAIGPELRADPNVNTLVEGVELTERELMKVMERHGVKKFTPLGEKFDPNLHQAMYEIDRQFGRARHRRASNPVWLHDRRADLAAGAGRHRQKINIGFRQRQFGFVLGLIGRSPFSAVRCRRVIP